MSRYTKDRWARAFKLLKFSEIGDMKPSDMMRQMKALMPMDVRPGTYFMASFLFRLPSDMIDHLIAKDFRDCTKMAEYADLLYSRRRTNAAVYRPILGLDFLSAHRLLVEPNRPSGAGLEVSETALQSKSQRR